MDPEVSLKSIEFESIGKGISSVKVNLSNGESSPYFEAEYEYYGHENHEVIKFDKAPVSSIRAVDAYDSEDLIGALQFYDKDKVVYDYNPEDYSTKENLRYQLNSNEELIGVYGVKDNWYRFKTFGFIVKVKRES